MSDAGKKPKKTMLGVVTYIWLVVAAVILLVGGHFIINDAETLLASLSSSSPSNALDKLGKQYEDCAVKTLAAGFKAGELGVVKDGQDPEERCFARAYEVGKEIKEAQDKREAAALDAISAHDYNLSEDYQSFADMEEGRFTRKCIDADGNIVHFSLLQDVYDDAKNHFGKIFGQSTTDERAIGQIPDQSVKLTCGIAVSREHYDKVIADMNYVGNNKEVIKLSRANTEMLLGYDPPLNMEFVLLPDAL